jgi:GTP 3',8-cyclase
MPSDLTPKISYLRLSITDRCNLRCGYCTFWRDWHPLPPQEILSYEELLEIARTAAGMGMRKIRLTGGEPLVRRGVVDFVRELHRLAGLEKVCLTTNGVLLANLAGPLYDVGLRHLNLSLDTLRRDRFLKITGSDRFQEVWAGLEQALALGFQPLKINCVALKGVNDDELADLALLARDHPLQVRFIELMPTLSPGWWARRFLPMGEVRRRLAAFGPLAPVLPEAAAGPARIFKAPGFRGELGFISPITDHHCRTCNRLRLTPAGGLRPCLLREAEIDLKAPLRSRGSHELVAAGLRAALAAKKETPADFPQLAGAPASMARIGG